MTRKIEDYVSLIKEDGIYTEKPIVTTSTVTAVGIANTGDATSTTLTATGLVKVTNPVFQQTITNIDAQNATPTIAQILGGIVIHTSVTGAGTVTVPTGALMSAGVSGVAVGSTIKWLYYNDGNQTATITAANAHTLVGGTAAVTTGKYILATSTNVSAGTWVTYLTTLF